MQSSEKELSKKINLAYYDIFEAYKELSEENKNNLRKFINLYFSKSRSMQYKEEKYRLELNSLLYPEIYFVGLSHLYSNKIYKDILLIINYNHDGFLKLNDYITNLYNKSFPNIIFINPSINKMPNIFSCQTSNNGYYSYNCFKNIYLKYPNYKGYLYINDDLFLKFWELQNLNFSFPWLNPYGLIGKNWAHYSKCLRLYNITNKKNDWKNKLVLG